MTVTFTKSDYVEADTPEEAFDKMIKNVPDGGTWNYSYSEEEDNE